MPEDVIRTLARFTPAAGLDRDDLLFRSGRASARPNRRWKAAVAALAAAQALTLAMWLATPTGQPAPAVVPAESPAPPVYAPESGPLPASSYAALSSAVAESGLPPAPLSTTPAGPPRPILTAAGREFTLD